jgi:hypothetical protein
MEYYLITIPSYNITSTLTLTQNFMCFLLSTPKTGNIKITE